jgi:hypothetical protein
LSVDATISFHVGVPAEALFVYSIFIFVDELAPFTFVHVISVSVEPATTV